MSVHGSQVCVISEGQSINKQLLDRPTHIVHYSLLGGSRGHTGLYGGDQLLVETAQVAELSHLQASHEHDTASTRPINPDFSLIIYKNDGIGKRARLYSYISP